MDEDEIEKDRFMGRVLIKKRKEGIKGRELSGNRRRCGCGKIDERNLEESKWGGGYLNKILRWKGEGE